MHHMTPLARLSQVMLGLAAVLLMVGILMLFLPGPGLVLVAAAGSLGLIGGALYAVTWTSSAA